tara:strand:- start:21 stop:638 length:618 start_codon:yes stop_codon:yes gene_type:complete
MALVKYNNNSLSAITSTGLTTGAMTLIKEQTASASSTISFVDGTSDVVLDSTYPIYKFVFTNINPSTDEVYFTFQTSTDTGSSYGVSLTSTYFHAYHGEGDGGATLAYDDTMDQANETGEQRLLYALGNGSDEGASGELWLYAPSDTTFVKHYMSNCNWYHYNDYSFNSRTAGYFNTTSAIDAIRFSISSGNFDGTIKLYGIKDS